MYNRKKSNVDLVDLKHIERNFSLRGSFNPDPNITSNSDVLERLGFTTSINSVLSDLERTGNIKIISQFSQANNSNITKMPTKFGAISDLNIGQINLNPAVNRIKQINSFILRILAIAIVINFLFILIF